jgi:hypothetical protein
MNLFFQFNQQKKISKSVFGVLIGVIFYFSQASFPFTHEMGLKQEHQPPINAVIGNSALLQSGVDLESLSEQAKIQTHLAFVENQLRSHTPTSISRSDYPRRQALLHYLAQYRKAGIFPSQNKYPGRRPHFIDQQGRICAVGYLIQKTAGLSLAQALNEKYEYAYLQDMQDDRLAAWVARSGFTLRELAMIQPSYGDERGAVMITLPSRYPLTVPLDLSTPTQAPHSTGFFQGALGIGLSTLLISYVSSAFLPESKEIFFLSELVGLAATGALGVSMTENSGFATLILLSLHSLVLIPNLLQLNIAPETLKVGLIPTVGQNSSIGVLYHSPF